MSKVRESKTRQREHHAFASAEPNPVWGMNLLSVLHTVLVQCRRGGIALDVCDKSAAPEQDENVQVARFRELRRAGVRSQESGVRSQESGVRSQESGVRSQESVQD